MKQVGNGAHRSIRQLQHHIRIVHAHTFATTAMKDEHKRRFSALCWCWRIEIEDILYASNGNIRNMCFHRPLCWLNGWRWTRRSTRWGRQDPGWKGSKQCM